jgi:nucleotide-binding universal stress UspA family protein
MGKIIIAVDPEGVINPIVEAGLMLGKNLNVPIDLISIVPKDVDIAVAGSGLINEEPWTLELEKIEDELLQIKNNNSNLDISVIALSGKPKEDLLDYICKSDASFIVLGTHGRTGITQMLLGGTAEYIVRHSTIPVVVVPLNTQRH